MVRTVDGKPRPFGADRPRRGGGMVLVAITLGIALATGGAITAVGSGSAGGSASGTRARAQDTATIVARWERRGLRVISRMDADDGNCAEHAYGQVQQFFRENPCTGLVRALFEVRDSRRKRRARGRRVGRDADG